MGVFDFLRKVRENVVVQRAAVVIDLGSRLYVSLDEGQKAMMVAQLRPGQMMVLAELIDAWDKLKGEQDRHG